MKKSADDPLRLYLTLKETLDISKMIDTRAPDPGTTLTAARRVNLPKFISSRHNDAILDYLYQHRGYYSTLWLTTEADMLIFLLTYGFVNDELK